MACSISERHALQEFWLCTLGSFDLQEVTYRSQYGGTDVRGSVFQTGGGGDIQGLIHRNRYARVCLQFTGSNNKDLIKDLILVMELIEHKIAGLCVYSRVQFADTIVRSINGHISSKDIDLQYRLGSKMQLILPTILVSKNHTRRDADERKGTEDKTAAVFTTQPTGMCTSRSYIMGQQ